MLKVYKRTLHIGQTEASHGRHLSMNTDKVMTGSMKISNWLTIAAMIAGAIVGILVFSVFFIAILIPLGLLGLGAWLRLRQLKNRLMDQSIEAEYTVITDTAKKQ
jgi:hypothetical protein